LTHTHARANTNKTLWLIHGRVAILEDHFIYSYFDDVCCVVVQLKDPNCGPLDLNYFKYNASVAKSPSFVNMREVCGRHKLPPGTYCVVPSTFGPNEEGDFLVRLFTEKPATAASVFITCLLTYLLTSVWYFRNVIYSQRGSAWQSYIGHRVPKGGTRVFYLSAWKNHRTYMSPTQIWTNFQTWPICGELINIRALESKLPLNVKLPPTFRFLIGWRLPPLGIRITVVICLLFDRSSPNLRLRLRTNRWRHTMK